jgi:hypothetical protein
MPLILLLGFLGHSMLVMRCWLALMVRTRSGFNLSALYRTAIHDLLQSRSTATSWGYSEALRCADGSCTVPEDYEVYQTLQQADTVGMFQIESRAQMASLPRNRPERFYDVVVQVAIIRPGPIAGKMMERERLVVTRSKFIFVEGTLQIRMEWFTLKPPDFEISQIGG